MGVNNDLSNALLTIQQHYPEEAALIKQNLEFIKVSRINLLILSVAMMEIRSKAQHLKQAANLEAGLRSELQRIEAIADSLHNVGAIMAKGEACDALNLYKNDGKSNWPTGIIIQSESR